MDHDRYSAADFRQFVGSPGFIAAFQPQNGAQWWAAGQQGEMTAPTPQMIITDIGYGDAHLHTEVPATEQAWSRGRGSNS